MNKRKKSGGFITAFVALMLVPMITFTGLMVDLSRMKFYSSQAAMAADSYGEAALSKYDMLLKELYGLFAMTQDAEALKAVEELAQYTEYSFQPNGDNIGVSGFMPYQDADVSVKYEAIDSATLGNHNVLLTQVSDFMKYRVYEELAGQLEILDILDAVSKSAEDMEAIKQRQNVAGNTDRIFEQIRAFYDQLKNIDTYPAYLKERENAYKNYATALNDIYTNESKYHYQAYKKYIANKQAIDAAKAKLDAYDAAVEAAAKQQAEYEAAVKEAIENNEEIPEFDESKRVKIPEITDAEKQLAALYIAQEEYLAVINQRVKGLEAKLEVTSQPIAFDKVEPAVKNLGDLRDDIKEELEKIEKQVEDLKKQLNDCSDGLRSSMEEEIKELEELVGLMKDFDYVVELFGANKFDSVSLDHGNKNLWKEKTQELRDVEKSLKDGTQDGKDWNSTISFTWKSFHTDETAEHLYATCVRFFEGKNDAAPEKDAGDKKIAQADKAKEDALNVFEEDETSEARDISAVLQSQLGATLKSGKVPGVLDVFLGNASLKGLGNGVVGKFLLSVYDFGMFSSRVSGIAPEEPLDKEGSEEKINESLENIEALSQEIVQEYFDESLTGIKMSKDVNYVYGAEIEYLLSGYANSDKNLTYARNCICAVRMTANYLATYTIQPINTAIAATADAAAAAVAATGVGAVAAPLVRFAVSGALRAAVAGIETASDWKALADRKEVIFYKSSMEDLTSVSGIIDALMDVDMEEDVVNAGEIALSYEDYMYILLCIFVDTDTLLQRTSNLITLNVNQAEQKAEELMTLNFKMNDTVTAVKSTCLIDLQFMIVPEGFINLFLSDRDATNVIQKLEDGKYAYSVIRGY